MDEQKTGGNTHLPNYDDNGDFIYYTDAKDRLKKPEPNYPKPEANPTKSIAWLSLTKEQQDNINFHYRNTTKANLSLTAQWQYDGNFANAIHNTLGTSRGYRDFLKDLEHLCACGGDAKGGIWDAMREYATKFRTIESAAETIEKERLANLNKKVELIDR